MSEATSRWYRLQYDWDVPAENIHPVADVFKVLEIALEHFSAPGSRIIAPTPASLKFLTVSESLGADHPE